MLAAAARFPDAFVRLLPDRLEMLEHLALHVPGGLVRLQAADARQMQRVHHFAVDVELELADRVVADAHGLRALVARQPVDLQLRQAPLAGDART